MRRHKLREIIIKEQDTGGQRTAIDFALKEFRRKIIKKGEYISRDM